MYEYIFNHAPFRDPNGAFLSEQTVAPRADGSRGGVTVNHATK